jgi:hypothetical protein
MKRRRAKAEANKKLIEKPRLETRISHCASTKTAILIEKKGHFLDELQRKEGDQVIQKPACLR